VDDPSATGQISVNAPADQVYVLISDVRVMSELAEETTSNTLLGGAATATVGTRFRGANRRGGHRWSTVATVTTADPGSAFAFDVTSMGFLPIALWRYDIAATESGCVVTESTWDRRPRWFHRVARLVTGVTDRAAVNRHNIEMTLQRLKSKAES
jgi:hypothetical protein